MTETFIAEMSRIQHNLLFLPFATSLSDCVTNWNLYSALPSGHLAEKSALTPSPYTLGSMNATGALGILREVSSCRPFQVEKSLSESTVYVLPCHVRAYFNV